MLEQHPQPPALLQTMALFVNLPSCLTDLFSIMKKLALLGSPITHSASTELHKAFAESVGIKLTYQLIDTAGETFSRCLKDFIRENGFGGNVTVPNKHDAFFEVKKSKGQLHSNAIQSQTVNTFWIEENVLHGDNTDGKGLAEDLLRLKIDIKNKNILIIGAGGAVSGILPSLLNESPQLITISNRTPERARILVQKFSNCDLQQSTVIKATSFECLNEEIAYDLIIQATPLSLNNDCPKIPPIVFHPNCDVYDLCYKNDDKTSFQIWAESQGVLKTYQGYGMLVFQAAFAFERWFGIFPERAVKMLINEYSRRCSPKKS